MADANHVILHTFDMGTSGAASQSTIVRRDYVRVREALLTGVLANAADTRVFTIGLTNPVVIAYQGIVEHSVNSVDDWRGHDYDSADNFASVGYQVIWNGPTFSTAGSENSFVFNNVQTDLRSQKYRLWFKYFDPTQGAA